MTPQDLARQNVDPIVKPLQSLVHLVPSPRLVHTAIVRRVDRLESHAPRRMLLVFRVVRYGDAAAVHPGSRARPATPGMSPNSHPLDGRARCAPGPLQQALQTRTQHEVEIRLQKLAVTARCQRQLRLLARPGIARPLGIILEVLLRRQIPSWSSRRTTIPKRLVAPTCTPRGSSFSTSAIPAKSAPHTQAHQANYCAHNFSCQRSVSRAPPRRTLSTPEALCSSPVSIPYNCH